MDKPKEVDMEELLEEKVQYVRQKKSNGKFWKSFGDVKK